MKRNQLLLILSIATILIPALAEATIYLMKGEKIVATYPDDAIDYVTFDDPTAPDIPDQFDVDNRSFFCNSNYYGDTQEKDGYNYSVQFIDLPFDDKGNIPSDAIYFQLYLKGPETTDRNAPFVPEGTYSLATDGEFIIPDNGFSQVIDHCVPYKFKNAWLQVSKNADKWKYEFTCITENDKKYHSVFDGVPNAYDQAIIWLDSDQHIQGGNVSAFYRDEKKGTGNITIKIAENGYDDEGWLKKPCNYLTLVGNVEMDERGNILPGKWTVTDEEVPSANTLLAGKCINFMGIAMPVNSNLQHWSSDKDVSVGLIKSGTLTVINGKYGMSYTYDFTTDKGKKISGVYQGAIIVDRHPYAESLKLENDYTLDFSDRVATCWPSKYTGDILVEVYKFDSKSQYTGDRVELHLVPGNGVIELQPGIYKVNSDTSSVGKIVPGTYTPQDGVGVNSVFVKYSEENPGNVLKAAGIKGGKVEVKKNDDNTWTLIYDLLDDQKTPKHIRGTWTGNFQ